MVCPGWLDVVAGPIGKGARHAPLRGWVLLVGARGGAPGQLQDNPHAVHLRLLCHPG